MQPRTLTRRKKKGKIYVKNIRKNSCGILNRIRILILRIRKKSFRIYNTASYIVFGTDPDRNRALEETPRS
jgi:hypothetical protein